MKLEIEFAGGNDIYAERIECTCLDPKWKDTGVAHLFKTKIRLSGYWDDYFFTIANSSVTHSKCQCGRKFSYQWFRSHVEFNWED